MRRAQHDKITAPNVVPCSNCSAPMISHRVCPSCGFYKGRSVLATKGQAPSEE
jgi:large subunit ribosomal protein L32